MSTRTADEPSVVDWATPERSEAPWRRAARALLRKRIAVVCILTITILYGAGAYTLLDAFGVDTGLQDPTASNLSMRRSIRSVDGAPESLGAFAGRLDVSIDTISALNPEIVDEYGPLSAITVLPAQTELLLREDETLQKPSSRHWFGTDRNGRDLFARALFSLRTTLIISVITVVFGNIFLGLGLGLLAGYRGGMTDQVIMRVGDVMLALPGLVFLIVIVAVFRDQWTEWFRVIEAETGLDWLIAQGVDDYILITFALSFVGWAGAARFYRAQVLALRETDYILAAETIGARTPRILVRHLFPGVVPWFVVGLSASLGEMAGAEVVLTWLGIGITPPTPSFGTMVSAAGGRTSLLLHPQMMLVPMMFLLVLMLAFNLLGDAVNDVLNPRGR